MGSQGVRSDQRGALTPSLSAANGNRWNQHRRRQCWGIVPLSRGNWVSGGYHGVKGIQSQWPPDGIDQAPFWASPCPMPRWGGINGNPRNQEWPGEPCLLRRLPGRQGEAMAPTVSTRVHTGASSAVTMTSNGFMRGPGRTMGSRGIPCDRATFETGLGGLKLEAFEATAPLANARGTKPVSSTSLHVGRFETGYFPCPCWLSAPASGFGGAVWVTTVARATGGAVARAGLVAPFKGRACQMPRWLGRIKMKPWNQERRGDAGPNAKAEIPLPRGLRPLAVAMASVDSCGPWPHHWKPWNQSWDQATFETGY